MTNDMPSAYCVSVTDPAVIDEIKKEIQSIIESNPGIAVVGRIQSWLDNPDSRYPISCTVFEVQDTMEGKNSIEESWLYASKGLRYGAGVAFDLSNIRPKGNENGRGLTASGPVSFMEIFSSLNKILRRGGVYKNGAIVCYLDYAHPDIEEFINANGPEYSWIKKAIYVDEGILHPTKAVLLEKVLDRVRDGTVWLAKKKWDKKGERLFSQVCVTGDTWVTTPNGAKQVKDLAGNCFEAHVNGENYLSVQPPVVHEQYGFFSEPSGHIGFFSTGINPVYKVKTVEGFEFRGTEDHPVLTSEGLVPVKDLKIGTKVILNKSTLTSWPGAGSFEQGWLLGSLIGDGTFATQRKARLSYWGITKELETATAQLFLENVFGKSPSSYISDHKNNIESAELAQLASLFNIKKGNKFITPEAEAGSSNFCSGLLSGYFDADSTVQGNLDKSNGKCISLTSTVYSNLQAVQRILLRFGIMSRICKGQDEGTCSMPDGKGGRADYECSQSWRLLISGKSNLIKFNNLIGFRHPEKHLKLNELIYSYPVENTNEREKLATVLSVEYAGEEETFDCAIDEIHRFDANGIIVSNCTEILLKSNATCLLMHTNVAGVVPDQLPSAMEQGMYALCRLHSITGAGKDNFYLSPEEDRQVGLGVLGFANFLAQNNVTYKQFVIAAEELIEFVEANNDSLDINTLVDEAHHYNHLLCSTTGGTTQSTFYSNSIKLVTYLLEGFQAAAKVARSFNMERAFTIAPTASCSYRYKDLNGYTTTPEISPPICHPVTKVSTRDSGTFGAVEYQYPPTVETAEEVGWDIYYRLVKVWQIFMEATGLAHAISFNVWNTCPVDKAWFEDWMNSPLVTTYYRMMVEQDYADKTTIAQGVDDSFLKTDFFLPVDDEDDEDEQVIDGFCPIGCESCSE